MQVSSLGSRNDIKPIIFRIKPHLIYSNWHLTLRNDDQRNPLLENKPFLLKIDHVNLNIFVVYNFCEEDLFMNYWIYKNKIVFKNKACNKVYIKNMIWE